MPEPGAVLPASSTVRFVLPDSGGREDEDDERADDLGSGGREQCESISHRAFLLKDFVHDTRTVLADVVTEAVVVRQLVEVRLQRGVQHLLGGADRIIELVWAAGADDR